MRIAFVVKSESSAAPIVKAFCAHHCDISDDPEIVVVVGGDGTLLRAEREHPGVPKVLIRDSAIGKLYSDHPLDLVIESLKAKQYTIEERTTLEAHVHGVTYRAANDVIIRNKLLTQAIRFTIDVPGEQFDGEFIGDGVIIATPMGSTAYYHTITRSSFTEGIGIAFNNIIQLHNVSPRLSEDARIVVHITRGPGELGVDNNVHTEPLQDGDTVVVQKCAFPMRIVQLYSAS
jgi:NAD+ kinase